MSCFFSHKYGKVEADGFQYCQSCGIARKPSVQLPSEPKDSHTCKNGHTWKDDKVQFFTTTTGTIEDTARKTFQTCAGCGNKRHVWG